MKHLYLPHILDWEHTAGR